VSRTDVVGSGEPFDGVGRRHPDIDDGEVRQLRGDHVHQCGAVGCRSDDVEPGVDENVPQSLPEQRRVLRDDNAQRRRGVHR